MQTITRRRRAQLAAAAVSCALALSACASTADGQGGGTVDDGGRPAIQEDPSSGLAAANDGAPIRVGVTYTANGKEANERQGAGAITRNDEAASMRALIDAVNDEGGIGGRELEPVFYGYAALSGETAASQDQAACSALVDDANIAVLLGSGLTDILDQCLLDAGVLSINSGRIIGPDDAYFERFPHLYDAGTLSQDRMMSDLVDTLGRLDYFSGWDAGEAGAGEGEPKIGIITLDVPEWTRPLESTLLPGLEESGNRVDDALVLRVPDATTEAEYSKTSAQVQNAVLRLTSEGVTHVIMLDSTGSLTLLFAQSAAQQGYFPRLGVNTASAPQALFDAGVLGAQQLNGAVGLGWSPTLDLPQGGADAYTSDATNECLDLIKAATGQTYTSTNAAALALSQCDTVRAAQATLSAIDGDLGLTAATQALEDLSGYESVYVPGSGFVDGRQDAVVVGHDYVWDADCECMEYVAEHRIP